MKIDFNEVVESVFRSQTTTICRKFRKAAIIFSKSGIYECDTGKLFKHVDALLYKFTLSVINLEFLWRVSEKHIEEQVRLYDGESFEWDNSNSIIDSTFLESTIVQIRAFIDFAQKLSIVRMGYLKPIDGTKDFYKILGRIDNDRSRSIDIAFREMDDDWGDTVRSLRDKVVHYGLIETNHEYRPQIQGKNYEEFAQILANNMFCFLMKLCSLLFDVDWESGTFEEFKKKYDR